jgi:hypothetical protein
MGEVRYTEVTDDSSHHYIIPVDRIKDWNDWYYSEDAELGHLPDYAKSIDGGTLTFTNPKIGDRNVD